MVKLHQTCLFRGTKVAVRFIGETQFAEGVWYGIEIVDELNPHGLVGKNDGSINGIRYFTCPAQKGLFVRERELLSEEGRLRQIIKKLDDKLFDLNSQISELENGLKSVSKENTELKEEIELSTIEKETLQEQIGILNHEIRELSKFKNLFHSSELELKSKTEIINQLKQQIDLNDKFEIIDKLTSENFSLQTEVRNLKNSVVEYEDLISLNKDFEKIHNDIEIELNNKVKHLNGLLIEKENLINALLQKSANSSAETPQAPAGAPAELEHSGSSNNSNINNNNNNNNNNSNQIKLKILKQHLATKSKILNLFKSDKHEVSQNEINKLELADMKQIITSLISNFEFNEDLLLDLIKYKFILKLRLFVNEINAAIEVISHSKDPVLTSYPDFEVFDKLIENILNEEFEVELPSIEVSYDSYLWKNSLQTTKSVSDQISILQSISHIIKLLNTNKFTFSEHFYNNVVKQIELFEDFREEITREANTEIDEVQVQTFNKIFDTFFKLTQQRIINNKLDIEFNINISPPPVVNKYVKQPPSETESKEHEQVMEDPKSVQIEELNLKIQLLNSKLVRFNEFEELIRKYKSEIESLQQRTHEQSSTIAQLSETNQSLNQKLEKLNRDSILNNYSNAEIIKEKAHFTKLELVSELKHLRNIIKSMQKTQQKRGSTRYGFLERELRVSTRPSNATLTQLTQLSHQLQSSVRSTPVSSWATS